MTITKNTRLICKNQSNSYCNKHYNDNGTTRTVLIRRPAGVSYGSCLFVVVLLVLSLTCLDFPLGADFFP